MLIRNVYVRIETGSQEYHIKYHSTAFYGRRKMKLVYIVFPVIYLLTKTSKLHKNKNLYSTTTHTKNTHEQALIFHTSQIGLKRGIHVRETFITEVKSIFSRKFQIVFLPFQRFLPIP